MCLSVVVCHEFHYVAMRTSFFGHKVPRLFALAAVTLTLRPCAILLVCYGHDDDDGGDINK